MMKFDEILKDRILVLDGALGTMIQKLKFKEEDYRGREFIHHPHPVAGFNDLLNLSKPSAIIDIHTQYLEAGANILTTNTFNSNSISMKDYGLDVIPGLVKKLNKEGDQLLEQNKEQAEETYRYYESLQGTVKE